MGFSESFWKGAASSFKTGFAAGYKADKKDEDLETYNKKVEDWASSAEKQGFVVEKKYTNGKLSATAKPPKQEAPKELTPTQKFSFKKGFSEALRDDEEEAAFAAKEGGSHLAISQREYSLLPPEMQEIIFNPSGARNEKPLFSTYQSKATNYAEDALDSGIIDAEEYQKIMKKASLTTIRGLESLLNTAANKEESNKIQNILDLYKNRMRAN